MSNERSELNELIRNVIQACAVCRHGRAMMVCRRNIGQCHNAKVRKWLKQIQEIQNEQEATWDNHS